MTEVSKLTNEERATLGELLESEKLCYNDINEAGVHLFAVKIKHVTVGFFGFEIFEKDALFRSLLVLPDARKRGYGELIWEVARQKLTENEVQQVYLLTNTAAAFFIKMGFEEIDRTSVPKTIATTKEFVEFCPGSSTCMKINLN